MGKNQNIGMMRKAFISLIALTGLISPGMGNTASHNVTVNRDAIKQDVNPSTPIVARATKANVGTSSRISGKRGHLNQRQYRRKIRSNPSILRSKKFRGKN